MAEERRIYWPAACGRPGQNIAHVRLALINKAELELGFRVCEHCGKRDRSVTKDRFDNILCKPCAEAEAAAEDKE